MNNDKREQSENRNSRRFRDLLSQGPIIMPGCWDALSARLAEQAGFDAVCITGGGVSQTLIGYADLGYITQTEMLDTARRISESVSIPVIADIDDGFGNVMNVKRTIEIAQRIGLAGVHIEDVAPPKRCPELGGSTNISIETMVDKLSVAKEYRYDSNFVIIARTDNYEGMDQLITRAKAYETAGADMIMPIGVGSIEDLKQLKAQINIPIWYGQIGGGSSPTVTLDMAKSLGIGVMAFTLEGFTSAYQAHWDYLNRLLETGLSPQHPIVLGPSFERIRAFEAACGMDADQRFQQRYFKSVDNKK